MLRKGNTAIDGMSGKGNAIFSIDATSDGGANRLVFQTPKTAPPITIPIINAANFCFVGMARNRLIKFGGFNWDTSGSP